MAQKRVFNEGRHHFKKSKKQKTSATTSDGSAEDVLLTDVRHMLKRLGTLSNEDTPAAAVATGEVELTIEELSSTGDGLAHKDGHVYVVPFAVPGDVVKANVFSHVPGKAFVLADFVSIVQPSDDRTETPQCPYFTECAGCQFQQLSYGYQLAHKRTVVEKAFANFSGLDPALVPTVGDTMPSPLQYGYRTKLTPHFDGPPNGRRDRRKQEKVTWDGVPAIGFMRKRTKKTMDIEDCPIGTEAVRKGMTSERARVASDIDKYQRGATLLLRESTSKVKILNDKAEHTHDTNANTSDDSEGACVNTIDVAEEAPVTDANTSDKAMNTASTDINTSDQVVEEHDGYKLVKTCITNPKTTSTEYVDDYRLDNPAGSFFQNNNSILPAVTQYVRDNILAPRADDGSPQIKHMIDAYCGSGLFTVTLSSIFESSIGIDISGQSIAFATKNAELNDIPSSSVKFIAGDANALFASVNMDEMPPDQTAVVIDPPRKGCDEGFIKQLMDYGPSRVCYVSCNVHSQARDIGWLVGGLGNKAGMYRIESLRGFDFFPQTSHVEGVAILQRIDAVGEQAEPVAQEQPAESVSEPIS